MRIAFFGSSLVSAYWNGAATYYRGIIRGLFGLGHLVTFYEPDAYDRQQNRDMEDPDWARVVIYSAQDLSDVNRCLSEVADYDVLVKASGVGVFDEYLERQVPIVGRNKTTIFWDVDAPATLDRVFADSCDPFRLDIPRYTAIFTYGGGPQVVERYLQLGAQFCQPIYNAADLDTHFSVPSEQALQSDLTLVANRLPDRESRIDEFFFRPASILSERVFLLGGNGWHNKPKPESVRLMGHVPTKRHNAVNCSAKAVLNVNRSSMAAYGYSPATRIFEAAAARSCIITDFWTGLDTFFEPQAEILVARSGWEVASILDNLTPAAARRIGEAAFRRVIADHTYDNRATQVNDFLLMTKSKSPEFAGASA